MEVEKSISKSLLNCNSSTPFSISTFKKEMIFLFEKERGGGRGEMRQRHSKEKAPCCEKRER